MHYWSFLTHNDDGTGLKNNTEVILDQFQFRTMILSAPLVSEFDKSPVLLDFPTPLGHFIQFEIVETPVLPEKWLLNSFKFEHFQ